MSTLTAPELRCTSCQDVVVPAPRDGSHDGAVIATAIVRHAVARHPATDPAQAGSAPRG